MNVKDKWTEAFDPSSLPSWDKDDLWSNIEPKLPEKKRRRGFFIWWFFAGLALILGSVWALIPDRPSLPAVENAARMTVPKNEKNINGHSNIASLSPLENSAVMGKQLMPCSSARFSEATPTMERTDQSVQIETALVQNIPTQSDPVFFKKSEGKIDLAILPLKVVHPLVSTDKPYDSIAMPDLSIAAAEITQRKKRSKNQWSFETGLFHTTSHLTAASSQGEAFAAYKKQSEKALETFTIDFLWHRAIGQRWSLATGLHYSRTALRFNHTISETTSELVASDYASFFNINGNIIYESGYIKRHTTVITQIESPARMERVFIPIQMSFSPQRHDKGLELSTGMLLNVFNRRHGYALDSQGNLLGKSDASKAGIYRRSGGARLAVSAAYHRPIQQKYAVWIGLRFQQDIGSFLSKSTGLTAQNQMLGIGLGLKYR